MVFVDLPVAETVHAANYRVPHGARPSIEAGDLLNHHSHCYMAGANNPSSWLQALDQVQAAGRAPTSSYPAPGAQVSGSEVFDDTRALAAGLPGDRPALGCPSQTSPAR